MTVREAIRAAIRIARQKLESSGGAKWLRKRTEPVLYTGSIEEVIEEPKAPEKEVDHSYGMDKDELMEQYTGRDPNMTLADWFETK